MTPTLGPKRNAGQIHGVDISKLPLSDRYVLIYDSSTMKYIPRQLTSSDISGGGSGMSEADVIARSIIFGG